ncbi:nifU-like protein [archaeon BMS3Abin17]|nr:nifU-like protein [archaeon BMS3Abin17]
MTLKYSKKVMQNFMHPKNMGEIKNADGIGKIGNPTCLLPDEKIFIDKEFREIRKAEKNHLVLSHDASKNKIIGKFPRNYKGEIITLRNQLGEITLTPEHLIYSAIIPKGDRFKRIIGKKTLIPAWHHSEQLKKGDIVLYPIPKIKKDIKFLKINIKKSKWDFKSKKIPSKISVTSGLLRLFGYFLSEGNIQDKPSKTYISFSLNIKETEIAKDIEKIVKKSFNLDVKTKENPKKNTTVVFIYNSQLARWFKKLFGNGAQNKYLPDFMMVLPIKKQESLIEGLWKGDGCINTKRIGARASYVTISYYLAQQLKFLLLRQGIIPSIYVEKEKMSKWANHKKAYRIHVGQRESLIKLCKILNMNYSPKSYESISSWIDKDILYTSITKIEKRCYKGKVYNLEVEKSHSFVSEAFCLHNCGDIMWVYIKVSKKGKNEIIKDIKFKTFGCMAAIATTSMITQLAKGKTLEQAKKISRDDVAKSLRGLPPIKMHCSNLASDALKLAIENYKKRK